MKTGLEYI